jgi:DNA-binding transcriptional LysR family regulator
MNADKCRVLMKAIELGSMSAASSALGYTPSGVSYIIDGIEKELGFKIVSRSASGLSLTEAGTQIFPSLAAFVRAEEAVMEKARLLCQVNSGEITVGTFPSIGRLIMPDIIQDFGIAYPDITINIVEGINEQLEQMMIRREVDFCICSAQPKGYDWFPLRKDPLVCILPKEHPLASRDAVTALDIENEKFIMPAYGRDSDILDLLKRLRITPKVVSYTLENSSAYAMVKRNMGITIVNELATVDQTSGICIRPFDPPQYIIEGIVLPSYEKAAQIAQNFIEFVKPYIGEEDIMS